MPVSSRCRVPRLSPAPGDQLRWRRPGWLGRAGTSTSSSSTPPDDWASTRADGPGRGHHDTINRRLLFVLDAMIGQDAVTPRRRRRQVHQCGLDRSTVTPRWCRVIGAQPVFQPFRLHREKLEDLTSSTRTGQADHHRGHGRCVLSLIEQAEQVFDAQRAEEAAAKMRL